MSVSAGETHDEGFRILHEWFTAFKPFAAEFAHVIWDWDPRATRSSYQISFAFLWTFVSELCLCNTCEAKIAVTSRHWKFCCVEISVFTCVGLRGTSAERTWMSSGLRVQTVTVNLKLSPELRKEKKTSFGKSDTSEMWWYNIHECVLDLSLCVCRSGGVVTMSQGACPSPGLSCFKAPEAANTCWSVLHWIVNQCCSLADPHLWPPDEGGWVNRIFLLQRSIEYHQNKMEGERETERERPFLHGNEAFLRGNSFWIASCGSGL